MKKLSFLFAALMVFAALFTSCEQKPEDGLTIDTEGAEVATSLTIYDEGPIDFRFPGLRQFTFEGYTGSVAYNPKSNKLTGSGYVFQIYQALSFAEGNSPLATKFTPFEIDNGTVSEIYSGGAVVLQYYTIEDGEINNEASDYTYNFSAEVVYGENGKVTIVVEGDFDGTRRAFYFDGEPQNFVTGAYTLEDAEPIDAITATAKYDLAEVIYYGASSQPSLPLNVIEVQLVDETYETLADIFCYGSLEDETNVFGTFKVAAEHAVGTAAQSAGLYIGEDGSSYPSQSFVVLNTEDFYFVKDGEITISEGNISFDFTTINGSKISTNFEGEFNVGKIKAPASLPKADFSNVKEVENFGTPFNYNPVVKF